MQSKGDKFMTPGEKRYGEVMQETGDLKHLIKRQSGEI